VYGLDLFSGIGGITKALEGYVTPVAYCENDRYAQGVILSRMATGDLPLAPIWDDVTTLRGTYLPRVDIIYGGFPCQDLSIAGRRKGLGGEHSGLFFQITRLASEIRPRFIFLENVPAITLGGSLGIVVGELSALRYDCRWETLPTAKREFEGERWFLLAKAMCEGLQGCDAQAWTKIPNINHETRQSQFLREGGAYIPEDVWAETVRIPDGIPFRLDRVKSLGNSVVPAQAREAFERLMGLKSEAPKR
jgi:DNA (cytosine-5)-methyltransferase 1